MTHLTAGSGVPLRSPHLPGRRASRVRRGMLAWLFLLPALAFYSFVVIGPTAQSVWFSLFRWNGVGPATWVGFGNYADFATDPLIGEALAHTGVMVVFFSVLPITLGLISAALLSRTRSRGTSVFRSIIFLPQVLTSVVIVVIWRQLFSLDGAVNSALRAIGLGDLAQPWLGSFTLTLPVLALAGTWTTMGLCMLLFVSGAGNIPTELYEAARIDGAGAVREFFSVTLPGLVPQLAVALTLTLIGALRVFDLVWLTTRGGPGTSSITPAVLLYSKAFTQQDVGGAAAIGVTLAVLSLLVSIVVVRITDRAAS
ncbi:carbohydrate ABC transporter permease [Schumannella luteola]